MKLTGEIIVGITALLGVISCGIQREESNSDDEYVQTYNTTSEVTSEPVSLGNNNVSSSGSSNYHTDSRYKYESRTGSSGNYEYKYDVEGSDEDGNSISGNVDMQGKYGSGTITDDNGDERDVDVEWTGYGTMEATDEDGNTYELEAE